MWWLCVSVCVCTHVWVFIEARGLGTPGIGVTGGCEPLGMGTGNWTPSSAKVIYTEVSFELLHHGLWHHSWWWALGLCFQNCLQTKFKRYQNTSSQPQREKTLLWGFLHSHNFCIVHALTSHAIVALLLSLFTVKDLVVENTAYWIGFLMVVLWPISIENALLLDWASCTPLL